LVLPVIHKQGGGTSVPPPFSLAGSACFSLKSLAISSVTKESRQHCRSKPVKQTHIMSNISSVASATNPYLAANQNGVGQLIQDFKAIGSALQSADLPTAQSALATFQQELQSSSQISATQPFGKNSQANTDFQSLTTDLQSGNLAGAQNAFSSLQNDLKPTQSAQSAHRGHHHQHHSFATGSTSTTNPTTGSTASGVAGLNLVA
jgi:hypothetical protein